MGRRWSGLFVGLVVGFSVACSGMSQSEEEAVTAVCDGATTCVGCPESSDPGFDDALHSHLLATVSHEGTLGLLSEIRAAGDDEKVQLLNEAAKAVSRECALSDVFEQRASAFRKEQIAKLCALASTCASFDGSDPQTVKTCAEEQLSKEVSHEISRMNLSSRAGLASNLEAYAAKYTTAGCALAIVLRDAP